MHWAERRRLAEKWDLRVLAAVAFARCEAPTLTPYGAARRRVTLVRVGGRTMDVDNWVGACKETIVDALVRRKVLRDDSPAWAELVYAQRRAGRGERPCVEVAVEELDNGGRPA